MTDQIVYLCLQGWHGRSEHPATLVGQTPKRYRIRLHEATRLPGGRQCPAGAVILVPKTAIRIPEAAA